MVGLVAGEVLTGVVVLPEIADVNGETTVLLVRADSVG